MKTCRRCEKQKPREEFYKLKGKQYKESWDCRDSLCKSCRSAYQTERRRNVKKQCIDFLGGKCLDCNLVDEPAVYDFHNTDPSQKDFSLGKNYKKFEAVKDELQKCVLLCANCHRKRHN